MDDKKKQDDLISRYVYAVVRHLPANQQKDVEQELKTLIEDMLETRCGTRTSELGDVEAVLIELGVPYELAAKYRDTKRYLIGPQRFDIYVMLLKIVLAVAGGAIALALMITYALDPPSGFFKTFFTFVSSVGSGMIQAFAWVTIVFAVLQHYEGKAHILKEFEWHPKDLPEVPVTTSVIAKSDPIASIVFIVLLFVCINVGPTLFDHWSTFPKERVIPLFDWAVFTKYLYLINISIALDLCIEIAKLYFGRYTKSLASISIIMNAATVIISIFLVKGVGILNTYAIEQMNTIYDLSEKAFSGLSKFCNMLPNIVVILAIIGFFIETVKTLYKTFWQPVDKS